MPCFNPGAERLDAAWQSVRAQSEPVEIILVNDGTTDEGTLAQIEKMRADVSTRIVDLPNGGVAEARNAGIRESGGRYILSLDSDDLIEPDYALRAADLMDSDERLGIVYCATDRFTDSGERFEWGLVDYSRGEMAVSNVIHGAALYRRADWEAVGGYRGLHYDDYDLWLSILELGREAQRIDEVMLHYRVTPNSIITSMDRDAEIAAQAEIYRHHPEFLLENLEHFVRHHRRRESQLAHFKRRYGPIERVKEKAVTTARTLRNRLRPRADRQS